MHAHNVPATRSVLLVLASFEDADRTTVQELCARSGLSRASVNRTIRTLQTRGLVRRQSKEFGGSRAIVLTDVGRRAATCMRDFASLFPGDE